MQKNWIEYLNKCLTVAVPLVAINTIDVLSCHSSIKTSSVSDSNGDKISIYERFKFGFTWNVIKGIEPMLIGINSDDSGGQYLEEARQAVQAPYTTNPAVALQVMYEISNTIPKSVGSGENRESQRTIFIMFLADRIVNESNPEVLPVIYELLMLREQLKRKGDLLILLGNMFSLPRELTDSFVVINEPLPSLDMRLSKVKTVVENAAESAIKRKYPVVKYSDNELIDLAEAVSGQSMFGAEQGLWLSTDREGISLENTLQKKYDLISATKGLSVFKSDGKGFAGLGGLSNIKDYFKKLIAGKLKTRVIVRIDELEKVIGGSGGKSGTDTSGVSTNFLGSLLSFMEDKKTLGALFTGIYGSGKTAVTKALGDETKSITIDFDLSGMKASLVGESEAAMRRALQVIESVAGDSTIVFVASCNRIEQLPPELRSRFNLGTFFFYFPDKDEREVIWQIYIAKYGLTVTPEDRSGVRDNNWVGREIEACCHKAYLMECSLTEASRYITPVCEIAKEEIASLVTNANNRYLSTSHDGFFNIETVKRKAKALETLEERSIEL